MAEDYSKHKTPGSLKEKYRWYISTAKYSTNKELAKKAQQNICAIKAKMKKDFNDEYKGWTREHVNRSFRCPRAGGGATRSKRRKKIKSRKNKKSRTRIRKNRGFKKNKKTKNKRR